MRFKIITAIWQSAQWFPRYVDSLLAQTEDFDVVICDDASTDGTAELVKAACEKNGWSYHLNPVRRGAACNQWHAVLAAKPEPEDILVFLDGDDRLTDDALTRLRTYYDDDTLLTYGQYQSEPFSRTCSLAGPYPQDVIDRNAYREHTLLGRGIPWNHLRTVRYKLFSQLEEADLKNAEGEWYKASTDSAVMYPCLELSGGHFKFIEEVLCYYNSENSLSDWRSQPRECDRCHDHILHRQPKVQVEYEDSPEARHLILPGGWNDHV